MYISDNAEHIVDTSTDIMDYLMSCCSAYYMIRTTAVQAW